jgi:hypothetical protein
MTPQEFQAIFPLIHSWIRETLASYSNAAKPVSSQRFSRLPHYFSAELLASAKFVTVDKVPVPPLSKMGLTRFAQFESGDFDGITYLDTFFLKKGCATDERLYFHELIHVVQWSLLGPERFLAIYAEYADGLEKYGYRDSPFEKMAYNAEATFVQSANIFGAEEFVANELARIGALPLEEKL